MFFMDLVAQLDDEALGIFASNLSKTQVPSGWPQLFGPKVVSRPGELSPGEYSMLMQMMPIWLIGGTLASLDETTKDQMMGLSVMNQKLWSLR